MPNRATLQHLQSSIAGKTFVCWAVFFTVASSCIAQEYDPAPEQLRVMTWNVEWMYDDNPNDNRSKLAREQSAPNKNYWQTKLAGVAEVIASAKPEIVALQEIEGNQTLREIIQKLRSEHDVSYRYAFIQGTDSFTEQDVGILMRNGLVSYRRHEQSKTMYLSEEYYNLSKHIVAEFRWRNVQSPLTVMNVHLRARAEVENIRVRQCKLARLWLNPMLEAEQDVLFLGDLNAESLAETQYPAEAEVAEITGRGKTKMSDLLALRGTAAGPTHLILDRQFDRIFASPSLMVDSPGEQDWVFKDIEVLSSAVIRGARDGQEHWDERLTMDPSELDLSDHFPVVATFELR